MRGPVYKFAEQPHAQYYNTADSSVIACSAPPVRIFIVYSHVQERGVV